MLRALPIAAVSLTPDAVHRMLADLRSAIDACEVDDGCHALPYLKAIERALATATRDR
jgi:hypothetical protein